MRLLLLLSALLTALSGVTGTRAEAQGLRAGVAVAAAVAPAAAARVMARPFAPVAFARPPLALPSLPRLVNAAAGRLLYAELYAERRRE